MRSALQLLIIVACACFATTTARLQRHQAFLQSKSPGSLLWSISLQRSQCPNGVPCFNVYVVNQTQGELNWFAYSTNSQGIKGFSLGKHAVYYSTWSGPGLYAVRAASGHVRWQFPLENWFKYWVKDIDLPPSASFSEASEVKEAVFVTAAGPPARLYALKTKTGDRLWEFVAPNASVELPDLATPAFIPSLRRRLVFIALSSPAANASWVTALDVASGSSVWTSEPLPGLQLDRLELDGCCRLLATTRGSDALLALNASNGHLLWRRSHRYCPSPSPIAEPYSGQLLLPASCDGLGGLSLLDAGSGSSSWEGWEVPDDAAPLGNCTGLAVKDGGIVFGCACSIQGKWSAAAARKPSGWQQQQQERSQSPASRVLQQGSGSEAWPAGPEEQAGKPPSQPGVCLYSVRVRSGKLDWVLPVSGGNASFPDAAQAWGAAPLLHQGLAIFLAAGQVLAVDSFTGRVAWVVALPDGESVHAWLQPVLDPLRNVLLVPAVSRGGNRTSLSAVDVVAGKLLWRRELNGTGQVPAGGPGASEPQRLLLEGDRVYVEACKGLTCCLRALHVSSGKQAWGVCLDAARGEDATRPRAQFAIWLITLVTIGSICLLILGACGVYVHRWSEERAILYGGEGDSPRHTYRPLPDGGRGESDSEGEEAAEAAARRRSFISSLRQAQAAGMGGGRQPAVQPQPQQPGAVLAGYVPASAVPAAAAAAGSRQHLPRVGGGGEAGPGGGRGAAWVAE